MLIRMCIVLLYFDVSTCMSMYEHTPFIHTVHHVNVYMHVQYIGVVKCNIEIFQRVVHMHYDT